MLSLSRRVRGLGALAGLVALLVPGAGPVLADAGPPPPSASREVLRAVHTDALHVTYEAGELGLQTRVGGSADGRVVDPADVVFNLEDLPSARLEVPDDPAFAFLGSPGTTVYMAPEVQQSDLIWPGWDTEALPSGALRDDMVDLTLLGAEGPGNVEVFFSPDLSGNVPRVFSAADESIRTRHQPVGAHVHANWAFTELGTYTLTFQASATAADGTALRSAPVDYTFVVGPYEPAGTSTRTTLSVTPEDAHAGDEVTLSATVDPAGATGWVEFLDGSTSLGHEQVADGRAAMTTTALQAGKHSLTARFTPAYADDWAGSTSPAVTYQVAGEEPPPTETTVTISGLREQYKPGDTVELEAQQAPATGLTTYGWFAKPAGASEFSAIEAAGTSAHYSFEATEALHGTLHQVRLYDGDGDGATEVARSEPARLNVLMSSRPCDTVDVVLDQGHVDVAARTAGGALQVRVKDGTTGADAVTWRALEKTAFHVKPESRTQVPDLASYRFLGEPGASIWQLPQTQDPALLWPGWNSEAVDYSGLDGPVRWTLSAVDGPGKLAIYEFDPFGQPLVVFDSGEPLPQHLDLAEPTHAHGNWAFTAEGIYRLTFTYSAKTKAGKALSASGTLPVAVGDTDLRELCPGGDVPGPGPNDPDGPDRPKGPKDPNDPGKDDPSSSPSPTATHDRSAGGAASRKKCVPATTNPSPSTGTSNDTSDAATRLSNGHADYAARIVGGKLVSQVKDGTVAGRTSWREPKNVVLQLTKASEAQVPAGSAFSFLGSPGSRIWQIPQTQKAGVLWLGWNTEELSASQVDGAVTWKLDKLEGPGKLAVFEFDSFGQPKVVFDSGDGLPDTYQIPLGTHAHGNWAFTKPGTYRATFTHSVKLAAGGESRDTEVVTFTAGSAGTGAGAGAPGASKTGLQAGDSGCVLAKTGSELWMPLLAGATLLGGGAILMALSTHLRRRRTA